MDQSYSIIATAIHKKNSIFTEPIIINHKNTHIDLSLNIPNLIDIFKFNKYTLYDLQAILNIYISFLTELTDETTRAMKHIIQENYNYNINMKNEYAKLKKKYVELEEKNNMLQTQNNTLIQTCNNICKIVCDNNVKIENDKLNGILNECV
jgi:hypothetical protein